MSVVIIGGNECMVRRYKEICGELGCKARVFPKMSGELQRAGEPDLLVLFTGTVSHKMIHCALNNIGGSGVKVVRSHSSSASALRAILNENISNTNS